MTIRTKVLLFAGVALILVITGGALLLQSASRAQVLRLQLASIERQLGVYAEMPQQAWQYLGRLLAARQDGTDTQSVLQAHERIILADSVRLLEALREEQQSGELKGGSSEQQRIEGIGQARMQWAKQVEAVMRFNAAAPPLGTETLKELFTAYELAVSPLIAEARADRHKRLLELQARLENHFRRVRLAGAIATLASCALLALLAARILVPLRELRALVAGAERIRQGDFAVELSTRRQDELGSLAQALSRMAQEVRETLREKEQRMKAEAEATEQERRREAELAARDIHRYNAALEQMVRARTAELESTNARLADSLRQLKSIQAQLMFADRLASVGRLAAGVGHEINNPLAYVISNLNYVHKELTRSQGTPTEEERQEVMTAIADAREGAERVRVIVQDLKTLSRPDDTASGLADLTTVVRSSMKIASHEIRRRARLVDALGELPPVQGNPARLGQVFLNLLINAAHAIPEGRAEENEIRVSAREEEGRVTVEIRDTGCGIPQENLERIFDPFFTTKPVGEGTGLGLALCHSIITALGGGITVESELNRGTTFRVSLPTAKPVH
jgi:two-component system, NtrC family, sensor kinase